MHDPFGSLGTPGPRRATEQSPAVDPWDTGERIFGTQWDTGEQRALDAEWEAGQRIRPAPRRVGHPRPARVTGYPAADNTGFPAVQDPGFPPAHAGYSGYPARGPVTDRPVGRNLGRGLTLALVVVLLLVAGWQAWRLNGLDGDNAQLAAVLAGERQRTDKLEKDLAGVFNPEQISSTVLPSVFRVRAGDFTGTAFAVGDQADKGQANLLTNFHVVESVWDAGGRKVLLERGGEELSATIVKVAEGKDLAWLSAKREIKGLRPAGAQVKPGQQIVVVGAPLGLEDSVTTGVVSAYRPDDPDGQAIQFDAPINPGNSGGPVVNARNEVVGLATAKARDAEGIGLAVAIKTACDTFKIC